MIGRRHSGHGNLNLFDRFVECAVCCVQGSTSCYGGRATRALRTILKPGTRLTLATDANLPNKDTDGALLRYATRGTTNMNRLIIQRGIAVPYFPNGKRGRLAARLLNDARTARATNRGLWAACPNAQLTPLHGSATGPA